MPRPLPPWVRRSDADWGDGVCQATVLPRVAWECAATARRRRGPTPGTHGTRGGNQVGYPRRGFGRKPGRGACDASHAPGVTNAPFGKAATVENDEHAPETGPSRSASQAPQEGARPGRCPPSERACLRESTSERGVRPVKHHHAQEYHQMQTESQLTRFMNRLNRAHNLG